MKRLKIYAVVILAKILVLQVGGHSDVLKVKYFLRSSIKNRTDTLFCILQKNSSLAVM